MPKGHEKIWPCKVGRDKKSFKSTDLDQSNFSIDRNFSHLSRPIGND